MNIQQFNNFIKKRPIVAVIVMGIVIAFGFYLMMPTESKKSSQILETKTGVTKEIGVAVGEVDKDAHIKSLDNKYYDFEDRMKSMEGELKRIQENSQRFENAKQETDQRISKLDQAFESKIQNKFDQIKNSESERLQEKIYEKQVELQVADINPQEDENWVYLPIGSFCKGTLLTGVYAAADANNPLPVLISLDEAFYGPNKSRIPLKGAFFLARLLEIWFLSEH